MAGGRSKEQRAKSEEQRAKSKEQRAKSEERRAKSEEQMLHQLRLYYGDNNLRALRLAAFALSS